MFRWLDSRLGHYAILTLVSALLLLPNLGAPSLWDIDEGNNAQAAREMLEADNWVIPTFNYQLRVDKPALLYWLQIGAYELLGVNEFAARLPSALCSLAAVFFAYELARRLVNAHAALLAALVLASTVGFCAAGHFANPDALLNACTVLTFFLFWRNTVRPTALGFCATGAAMGLAVLAKGPVGFVLPATVMGMYLILTRQWGLLFDRRQGLVLLSMVLVAVPWYGWVTAETKAEWLRGFLMRHNVERFLSPMERHSGGVWYYPLVLIVGFLPWSAFLVPCFWPGVRDWHSEQAKASGSIFLGCWIGSYLLFFSLAQTKLPNYVLPVYAPLAILMGQFLDGWRTGRRQAPRWAWGMAVAVLLLTGVGYTAVTLAGRGFFPDFGVRPVRGLEKRVFLGLIPLLGLAAWWWQLRQNRRDRVVAVFAVTAIAFIAGSATWGPTVIDKNKAVRPLARLLRADEDAQSEREVRVGAYKYFRPSLVFYCGREVHPLDDRTTALDFLRKPLPTYLFVPAVEWERLRERAPATCRVLGKRHDLYARGDVVLVANR